MALLEVCVDNVEGLLTCDSTNVKQVELCSALELGGLTPSFSFIKLAANLSPEVRVLIRPRYGSFVFTENELSLMCDDIAYAADAGVQGVVLGVAHKHGGLNHNALERLCNAAGTLNKTLHRVIDTLENPLEAMEQAIDLGFDTILTSGGVPKVNDGIDLLKKLTKQANGRINIMAGAGLKPSMVHAIHKQTGIVTFHSSCTRELPLNNTSVASLGFGSDKTRYTDSNMINEYYEALSLII